MKPIGEYISLFQQNKGTQITYRGSIYKFLDFKYGKQRKDKQVTEAEKEIYEGLMAQYLESVEDFSADMLAFSISLESSAPITAKNVFSQVVGFFEHHDLELNKRERKRTVRRLPKGGVRTVERDMDAEVIRKILFHSDAKATALYLILASSGMRIGEALQIRVSDVNLDAVPAEITIRGEYTKTGHQRYTFISDEATAALIEWLKVREDYIRAAQNKNRGLIDAQRSGARVDEDRRLFPFSANTAYEAWRSTLKKAGLYSKDESTGRTQIHIHQFRKFFISQLSLAGAKEVAETLAGHEGYLTSAYRRYTKTQLAEEYLEGMERLNIYESQGIRTLNESVKEQKEMYNELALENTKLKKDFEALRQENELIRSDERWIEELINKRLSELLQAKS
ncbi:hypothetical protein AZH53_06185 [Methanomicrobiaceae archaeon CYW5]|uniref:site-specific integrase n=1 Tax=Methanovulcanius yangii TaxID=1789227 RepID=UPI0029CAAAE7|nr:site-specific integrase [Methanovulcanius yangii]MBT8507997.1 hypothetical protein [Methanovulcanius yangii]